MPRLSRVAVLGNSTNPGNAEALKETELGAGAFAVKLQYLDVVGSTDIETAFRAEAKAELTQSSHLETPSSIPIENSS